MNKENNLKIQRGTGVFLQGLSQRNIWGFQVWAVKWPNTHKNLEHIFFQCKHDLKFCCALHYNELIQKWSEANVFTSHDRQHWSLQNCRLPQFFYQNIHLQLSLFLKRKGGKDIARKNNCCDTSYLRCNTGLFVAVNRGEARSVEIGNTFYDILEKKTTSAFKPLSSDLR